MTKHLPFSRIRSFVVVAALLVLTAGIGYRLGERHAIPAAGAPPTLTNTQTPASANVDFSLFWDVWQRLFSQFIDAKTLDPQKMVYGAISGMVAATDDPYTSFLPPKENQAFKEDIGGSFQGIGAQLGLKDSRVMIVAPLEGSPAKTAGILAGDYILKVNDEDTSGWSTEQAVAKIRGPKGTKVTLNILHDKSTKPVDVTITRDDIVVPSVDSWIKPAGDIKETSGLPKRVSGDGQVAYIHLSRFGDRTNDEWLAAVDKVDAAWKNHTIRGLVFDLRDNPGGYLEGAVFIASEFIKSGTVVSQVNSDGTKQNYNVERAGKLLDIPLVVLINKGSASAAEIVAGALKDTKRAKLVGEKSFGKGSVQTPEELKGGASLHVTTGKWLLPSGSWIHKVGIQPDVAVTWDDPQATNDAQLEKAVELLLE
jgi:carboxyl-terminal processing protease